MQMKSLLTTALVSTAAIPAVSLADLSANAGIVSDYIFRGIFQEDSSPYGGFDYESDSGIYAGVWGADVGLGMEIDLYGGYGGSFADEGSFSVGFTGYFYTEDGAPSSSQPGFYDTITEVNLGVGYGIFSIDLAIGEEDLWGNPADYTFTTITIAPEVGPYYAFNSWGDDYDGDFIEIGYGWTAMDEIDLSVAWLYAPDADDPGSVLAFDEGFSGYSDSTIVFGVSKTFPIGD